MPPKNKIPLPTKNDSQQSKPKQKSKQQSKPSTKPQQSTQSKQQQQTKRGKQHVQPTMNDDDSSDENDFKTNQQSSDDDNDSIPQQTPIIPSKSTQQKQPKQQFPSHSKQHLPQMKDSSDTDDDNQDIELQNTNQTMEYNDFHEQNDNDEDDEAEAEYWNEISSDEELEAQLTNISNVIQQTSSKTASTTTTSTTSTTEENNEKVSTLSDMMKHTTISALMDVQRNPVQITNDKRSKLAAEELELTLEEVDTLANHFAEQFITTTYNELSDNIVKQLKKANLPKNSSQHVLMEYNPNYQRQTFKGFNAGRIDLDEALTITTTKPNDNEYDINSTMLSRRVNKDHSKNIDDIVAKVDIVGDHIANRYDNEVELKARLEKRKQPKTSGQSWFDMPKTKFNKETIEAWAILQHKGQLTGGKGNFLRVEKSKMPKYSQMGTYIGDSNDGSSLTKKESKRSLAEQFIDDMKSNQTVKKRFRAYHEKKQNENGTGTQYSGIKRKYKK